MSLILQLINSAKKGIKFPPSKDIIWIHWPFWKSPSNCNQVPLHLWTNLFPFLALSLSISSPFLFSRAVIIVEKSFLVPYVVLRSLRHKVIPGLYLLRVVQTKEETFLITWKVKMESNFKSPHISEEDWIRPNTFGTHRLWLKFWRFGFWAPEQRKRGFKWDPSSGSIVQDFKSTEIRKGLCRRLYYA